MSGSHTCSTGGSAKIAGSGGSVSVFTACATRSGRRTNASSWSTLKKEQKLPEVSRNCNVYSQPRSRKNTESPHDTMPKKRNFKMRLQCSISNDGVSDRSGRIDSPAHKKNATALIQRSHSDSLWRLVVIGTVWRSGLAYDGCDELDATAGGPWPRSRWYCSNQPSRIMTAGRKS